MDTPRATASRVGHSFTGSVVLAAPLLDLDLDYLTPGVVAAMWADVMLPLHLAALRAGHDRRFLNAVVLADEPLLCSRSPLFWKRTHS